MPKAVQKWEGKHVFAEPTVLEVLPGATVDLGARTSLVVEKGSSLLIRKGANVIAARTGQIVVEDGAYIYIEEGAVLPASFFSRNLDISPQAIKAVNPLIENGLKPILPKLRAL